MRLYLCVTRDEYELPLAVADSLSELAKMCGVTKAAVASAISHESHGHYKSRYKRVIVEDDE